MEIYYFITGTLTTAVAVLLYQYRKILVTTVTLQKNHKAITETYDKLYSELSSQLSLIGDTLSSDSYADQALTSQQIKRLQDYYEKLDTSVNLIAKKCNDLDAVRKNDKMEIKATIESIFKQGSENRGY